VVTACGGFRCGGIQKGDKPGNSGKAIKGPVRREGESIGEGGRRSEGVEKG